MQDRRDFLKLSGLGAISMLACGDETARGEERRTNLSGAGSPVAFPPGKKIDFHSHAILPSYVRGLKELGIDAAAEEGFPLPKWTLEAHLEFMAAANVDYSILSLPTPHIYRGDAKLAARIAREINEETAELCRANPDKFGFVAALPMPDVKSSLEEIRYSIEELGALGVKVASNSDGVYLGDPSMDEIFAELDRRKSLVVLHPSPARSLPRGSVVTGRVMALFEYPTDTTRAVLNLLANGTLERYPNIRMVVPHTGSFLPYMKQRAKGMFELLSTLKMMEPVDLETGFGKLYFDLAGDPMPEEMNMLLDVADKGRIVYGSDYPYVLAPILFKKKGALDRELTARNWMKQVYVENAAALLPTPF